MTLRLLVAVDGSAPSTRAVEHAARVAGSGGDVSVTLFHTCPHPPARLETGGAEDPQRERALEETQRHRRKAWEEEARTQVENDVFAPARRVLVEAGLPEKAIRVRSRFDAEPHPDVAQAIVEEAAAAHADAVVIGRHGQSKVKSLVLGSVSSRVVERLSEGAVWIVE
jgi:nucleotide-binding universal stress UspA family protein